MTLFPGGEDTAVPLLNEAVKPVGEKDIEFFGFHIDGKVNVTLGGGDGKRPLRSTSETGREAGRSASQ